MEILRLDALDNQYLWHDAVGLATQSLGEAAGSRRLYVNIDSVPPGAYSTKYHSHSQQEEFFLVLEGAGTLRLSGEEHPVSKGDFFAKPAGEQIAHTFYNSSSAPLVILDVGTVEPEDTCYYPDADMYLQKSNGVRRIFSGGGLDETWSPYPNGEAGGP